MRILRGTQWLLAFQLSVLFCLSSCRAVDGEARTPREYNERVNDSWERILLGTDTLTPVEGFDEEGYFEELERIYAEHPKVGDGNQAEAAPLPEEEEEELNPYLEFGERIWIDEGTGLITKPFVFPSGMGGRALNLLWRYGDFDVPPEGGLAVDGTALITPANQLPDQAVFDLRTDYDGEPYADPQAANMVSSQVVPLSDWLFVRAQPDVLLKVQQFIDLFSEQVRQIEIEARIIEVSTRGSFDYGISPVDADTPIFNLPNSGTLLNRLDYSLSNTVDAGEALFGVSAIFDEVEFNALLEIVAEDENVSIMSRPKVAVREGARAEIINTTDVPYFKITGINTNGNFSTQLTMQPVGVQMYIIPTIIGENTISLNIRIEASQVSGTAVSLNQGGDQTQGLVTVPEITLRRAATIVRLEPGQAVVLGGLIAERTLQSVRKIPLLGDLPLLGNLFRNELEVKDQTNVLFYVRPRILQGIDMLTD